MKNRYENLFPWVTRSFCKMTAIMLICINLSCSLPMENTNTIDGESISVLFIGHSFTKWHNMPWVLDEMAADEEPLLISEMFAEGGASLSLHWMNGEVFDKIKEREWDYVVLQGLDFEGENRFEYAMKFDSLIKRQGGKTVFFQRWAYKDNPGELDGYIEAFKEVSSLVNGLVAPVGMAWKKVIDENPGFELYDPDRVHANPNGAYLTACVFYSLLYKRSPVGLPRYVYVTRDTVVDLTPEDALMLQTAAYETVTEYYQSGIPYVFY